MLPTPGVRLKSSYIQYIYNINQNQVSGYEYQNQATSSNDIPNHNDVKTIMTDVKSKTDVGTISGVRTMSDVKTKIDVKSKRDFKLRNDVKAGKPEVFAFLLKCNRTIWKRFV